MFGYGGRALPELCGDLSDAVLSLDEQASTDCHRAIVQRVPEADQEELSAGLVRLTPALERVALGNGVVLAHLAAGLVEMGADPLPVLGVLVERIARGLEQAALFAMLADKLGDGVVAPTSADEVHALQDRVAREAPAAGLAAEDAWEATQAWFTVNDWIPGLLLPLQQKRSRLALPQRDRLTDAAGAMTEQLDDAPWLYGLVLVLDDEPLLVVQRDGGRAYEVTISGIGDNFQLHTLLAATLIGDPARGLIPGVPPEPAWVAAATDGDMTPEGGIRGQFNLVDATGEWIWNEGRPADIPLVGDHRVVVLDPPAYPRGWNLGRAYPLMTPQITLDRILAPDEAAGWLGRIAPDRRGQPPA